MHWAKQWGPEEVVDESKKEFAVQFKTHWANTAAWTIQVVCESNAEFKLRGQCQASQLVTVVAIADCEGKDSNSISALKQKIAISEWSFQGILFGLLEEDQEVNGVKAVESKHLYRNGKQRLSDQLKEDAIDSLEKWFDKIFSVELISDDTWLNKMRGVTTRKTGGNSNFLCYTLIQCGINWA